MRLSCRPHYASGSSVYPSVAYGLNSKTKKTSKNLLAFTCLLLSYLIKVPIYVPRGTSKRSANFRLKRSEVKSRSLDVKNLKNCRMCGVHVYLRAARLKRRRLRSRLHTTPNPLLGIIYRRRLRQSVTGWTAAHHVGTRRRHLFNRSIYFIIIYLHTLCP